MSGPSGQAPGGAAHSLETEQGRISGRAAHEASATEKLACDRCRQRKTKCDRVNPCSRCIEAGLDCAYNAGQKVKPKRQRVLISSIYESRMEHISRKIDELSETMKRLNHPQPSDGVTLVGLQPPVHPQLHAGYSRGEADNGKTSDQGRTVHEAQAIESALFANVVFAGRFLQGIVAKDPHPTVVAEMTSVLDTLQRMITVQSQHNQILEDSPPFLKSLPWGSGARGLPLPPTDRILACLRVAHERSPIQIYWPFEFGSLGDFTKYVIKACSPGPVTQAELIIVHFGLLWLFTECSRVAEDDTLQQEYDTQAAVCRNSLETILSHLSIHIPTGIDSVCAIYMASLHSLQCGKPLAAWTFISRASLMTQALGWHSNYTAAAKPREEGERAIRLFWAVYVLEKTVALRLGRSSTIRDQDVTVPRLSLDRRMTSLLYNRLPDWIEVASLYSRVYDDIFSPSALAQPASIRESRVRALAGELKEIMATRAELYAHPNQWTEQTIYPWLRKFIIHANRTMDYSILACIYRAIPSESPSDLAPCPECIESARATLQEAEECISVLAEADAWSPSLDLWLNEILLFAPFIPFLILFCHVVNTSDPSDLHYLQRSVDGLQSIAHSPRYDTGRKQVHVLKLLYDIAVKYVEIKAKGQRDIIDGGLSGLGIDAYLDGATSPFLSSVPTPNPWLVDDPLRASAARAETAENEGQNIMNPGLSLQAIADQLEKSAQVNDGSGMELDTAGAQLGPWFHQSHQFMRLLEEF